MKWNENTEGVWGQRNQHLIQSGHSMLCYCCRSWSGSATEGSKRERALFAKLLSGASAAKGTHRGLLPFNAACLTVHLERCLG